MKLENVRLRRSNFFISVGLGMMLMTVTTVLTIYYLSAYPMPTSSDLIIGPVHVVDVEGRTLLQDHYVRISGGLITGLSPEPFPNSENSEFDRIEAKDQYLLPGFIDAQIGFPLEPATRKTVLEVVWDDVRGNPETRRRLLRMGITSLNIFGYQDGDGDPFLKDNKGRILESPDILVSGPVVTAHPEANLDSRAISVDDVTTYLENNINRINTRIIKLIYSNDRTAETAEPPAADPGFLTAVLEEAQKWGFSVVVQTHNGKDLVACLQAGVKMIECGVLYEPIPDSLIVQMKDRDVFFIPSLAFVATMDLWKDSTARMIVEQNVRSIHHAGIKIAALNSMARVRNVRKIVTELKLLSGCGIDLSETLSAASIANAYCLGRDKEIGSIRTGKIADLVIVQSNPLLDLDNLQSIQYVLAKGYVVVEPEKSGLFNF